MRNFYLIEMHKSQDGVYDICLKSTKTVVARIYDDSQAEELEPDKRGFHFSPVGPWVGHGVDRFLTLSEAKKWANQKANEIHPRPVNLGR